MKKIIKSFADKRVRYGAFSTLTAILIVAVLASVNLVFSKLDIKHDLSPDQKFTLSKESKDILSKLDGDVTIYVLSREGGQDIQFRELFDEYKGVSKHLSVVYKDPVIYPTFVEKYKKNGENIPNDSVIVEKGTRFKVIKAEDLYTLGIDYNTYSQYIKSVDIEPQVTNAVKYVSDDNTPIIYEVANHNELTFSETMKKQLSLANYELRTLNLFEDSIPADAAALVLSAPERDYSAEEAAKVKDYLSGGGKAFILVDYSLSGRPNFISILHAYGLTAGDDLVAEERLANKADADNPFILLPNYENTEITDGFAEKNIYVALAYANSITKTGLAKNSTKIEPILTTSKQSYAKHATQGESISPNREAGDTDGPFILAAAVTDAQTRIVAVGGTSIIEDSLNQFVVGGNADFDVNAINWLVGKADNVYIPPKTAETDQPLVFNDLYGYVVAGASVLGLPAIILVCGIVVSLGRRSR
ncbi:hypothetical protein AGMMS49975_04290 [Clostridia bacterium]|nr:hypothetical protein AGMMS49975_04290 [Clostridia bacterium]